VSQLRGSARHRDSCPPAAPPATLRRPHPAVLRSCEISPTLPLHRLLIVDPGAIVDALRFECPPSTIRPPRRQRRIDQEAVMGSPLVRWLLVLLVPLCFSINLIWAPSDTFARGSGGSHSGGSHSSGHHSSQSHAHSKTAPGVQRDNHGRITRSAAAKDHFKKSHPCPSTGKSRGACPGYVIDHVVPLKRGGKDASENMQWQTKEAAKLKDRTE
jgi:hypothetical protein